MTSSQLHKKIGALAREATFSDPHTPVWVSGLCYPVQYMVRQTRSMVSRGYPIPDSCHGNIKLIVSIPLMKLASYPRLTITGTFPPPAVLNPLDFFLPDKIFQKEKLEKLREISQMKTLKYESTLAPKGIDQGDLLSSTTDQSNNRASCEVVINNYNNLITLITLNYNNYSIQFCERLPPTDTHVS